MQQRTEKVMIETARHRIVGEMTMPADGYRSRMSDFLNSHERDFISLINVTVERLDGGRAAQHEYVAVARDHIVLAAPVESDEAGK